ncbi:MAG: amidohydrolase family protein [Vicinamibacterales bacterium]
MHGQPDLADVLVRAAWVCPIATPPLQDGWVAVSRGRITAVGRGHDAPPAREVRDVGGAAIVPGLVNAHTHLELSWLRGRVPPAADFLTWVGRLMALRRGVEDARDPAVAGPIREAIAEAAASGTVAFGDIANALITPPFLAEAAMPAVVFHELLGFRVTDGAGVVEAARARHVGLASRDVRIAVAPHAPFSVSAELFEAIRDAVREARRPTTSVHLAESPEEVRLLADGSGPWKTRLGELGAWRQDWQAPGRGPGDYLCDLGVLGPGALAVHGVHLTDAELERLAANDVTLVTCPRSNRWVGVGDPPVARFLASGVRLAVGTDSLASVPDLNLFGELAALRAAAPEAPARRLLAAATSGGAHALGLGDEYGALEVGKRAVLVAVDLPAGVSDAEEALLAGVDAASVHVLGLGGYHETAV